MRKLVINFDKKVIQLLTPHYIRNAGLKEFEAVCDEGNTKVASRCNYVV